VTPLDDYLRREIDLGTFPGAVYAIGSPRSGIGREGALGHAVVVPARIAATPETIYDCASITKTLVTTTLVLQAIAEKRIALDDRYRGYSYRELLTHTSGLRAWLPLYAYPDYVEAVLEHGPETPRGTRVVYSDLNFVLLWAALRELFGDYVTAARTRIFEPLGLRHAYFQPPPQLRPRIAATEWTQRWEQKMCAERAITFTGFREGLMWGETHDGNSHHAGGTAGNAGLFATARDVFRIAQAFDNGELVPRELVAEATRNHTAGMEDGRGLGWQKPTGSTATAMLSDEAYGHTGFTGTSVWIDPPRERIMVLLTNRVHPCAATVAMQRVRGEFHRHALG
jgi:CubicO group peptidase (beta-lactamase class C family)